MGKRTLNNKGISLLEYIIVIAIMVTLVGMITYSLGFLLNKPADQCASQLKIAIEQHRQLSMGKNTSDMLVYVDPDNGVYVEQIYDGKGKVTKIGAKGVTVKYEVPGMGYTTIGDSSNPTHISFNRTSGALVTSLDTNGTQYYRCTYTISKGTKQKTLEIVPLTGKITIH